jgi:hypothetical protein
VEVPRAESGESQFDWRIYADATCAGLSVLIPVPLVDLVFETIFRRRIPGKISKTRGSEILPRTKVQLARPVNDALSLSGCLAVPFMVVRYVLRRLWRKIIYIFAVKDATTALTEYWHRAFLTDHMVRAGHLVPDVDTDLAVRVYRQVLQEIDPSPLTGLARQTVANARNVLRVLVRARRLGAAEVAKSFGEVFSSHWKVASQSLVTTSQRYNARYAAEIDLKKRTE